MNVSYCSISLVQSKNFLYLKIKKKFFLDKLFIRHCLHLTWHVQIANQMARVFAYDIVVHLLFHSMTFYTKSVAF